MISVKIDISQVTQGIKNGLEKLKDKEYLLRPVAQEQIRLMHDRIHEQGKDSGGNQIGTYSPGYMTIRTGKFKNSTVISKGKRKGEVKDSGVTTKGKSIGAKRVSYNRTSDTKVVISLTRQLENDYTVVATPLGYGVGFNNKHNFDKANWVENTYERKIFDHTQEELDAAIEFINELTQDALNS